MFQRLFALAAVLALPLLACSALPAAAVTFVDAGFTMSGAAGSGVRPALAWGDDDGDGDLDLLVSGSTTASPGAELTRLYRNTGGTLAAVATSLPALGNPALAWGDYDRDGDLDVALSGITPASVRLTRIYRNDGGGTFVDIVAGLPGVATGSLAWGDYDRDGDLDLAVSGTTNGLSSGAFARIYRNDGGTFVDAAAGLVAAGSSALAWGDVDGDGDLDLLVSGSDVTAVPRTTLYRNDAGTMTPLAAGLTDVNLAAVAFGDLDGDGDLDLALCGANAAAAPITALYTNNGAGTFTALPALLTGLRNGGVAWGDCDGDGDLDLAFTGQDAGSLKRTRLARNDGSGAFTELDMGFANAELSALAWGDFDGDGRLDLALAGRGSVTPITKVYRNTDAPANAPPTAPTGLAATVVTGPGTGPSMLVTFSWTAPTDAITPQNALTYELRVGTTPGGAQVTGAAANGATGYRRVQRFGGTWGRESWTLTLPRGLYYWSVQAVDGGLLGGAFAAEESVLAQPFVDAGFAMTPASGSFIRPAVAWGDHDFDGDLDLLVCGSTNGLSEGAITTLYRNTGGSLSPVSTSLPAVGNPALAWGDYDRDDDLDLALSGNTPALVRLTRIYRNDGAGNFVDIAAGLPGVGSGGLAWVDYDLDGDLDLALSGSTGGGSPGATARIYRNDNGTFVDAAAGLVGAHISAMAWGDVDGDGDPDLVVSGYSVSAVPTTTLYRNNAGAMTPLASGLAGVYSGAFAFGDLDADGDLDLALCGTGAAGTRLTALYTNDGTGTFTALPTSLPGYSEGGIAWGDYDGDGDLDLAFTGGTMSLGPRTRLARNDGGGAFTELDLGFLNVEQSALAWGDLDGDGRLDLALAGLSPSGISIAKVYRNLGARVNAPPSPPSGLGAYKSGVRKVLRWDPASDAQTPAGGLSYDVRIGISTQGGQIVSLPADSASGLRRLPKRGAAQADSFVVTLPDGIYYFTVQAVDAGFAGSALPAWQTVLGGTVGVDDAHVTAPTALAIHAIAPNPLRHSARVAFDLPREGDVDLSVYDVSGRHVATLLKARFAAGRQAAVWDGRGDDGVRLSAGVYLVRLRVNGDTDTRRVVLAQ